MNDSYAPRSPDLSSFQGAESPYHPRSPQIPDYHQQEGQHEGQYFPIPPLPQAHSQFGSGAGAYQNHAQNPAGYASYHSYQVQQPGFQPRNQYSGTQPYNQPTYYPPAAAAATTQQTSAPISIKKENSSIKQRKSSTAYPTPNNSYLDQGNTMAQSTSSGAVGNGLGPSQGIEIKTKFPVARIKRIMQADEEVGKVAQVTPVAVSKALELFMISLCTKSADVARNNSSKRITAAHLKAAIEADEQFDFLKEITSKVSTMQENEAGGEKKGRGRVKAEHVKSEADGSDAEDAKEKKVKTTRGRKKKVAAESE